MSRFMLSASLVAGIAVSPPVALAQRMTAASWFPYVAPPAVDTTRSFQERRISGGSRFGAILLSSTVGLGIGHYVMGFNRVGTGYLVGELAAAGVFAAAFDKKRDEGAGLGLALVGGGLYIAFRVLELGDVVIRPGVHNARIDAAERASTTRSRPQARIAPIVNGGQKGLALSISF